MQRLYAFVIAGSAAATIAGSYGGAEFRWIVYIFKPLTTILILLSAITTPRFGRYERAIAAGLVFSLAGDVFLMLPSDQFLAGLASFLVAHICYLAGFTTNAKFAARWEPFVFLGAVASALVWWLWTGLPSGMHIPVVLYAAFLASMAAQAVVRRMLLPSRASSLAAAGGLLFVISDAALSINRFAVPFEASTALVLSTYFSAQYLIARSVRHGLESGAPIGDS